jgi:hypothetical protein
VFLLFLSACYVLWRRIIKPSSNSYGLKLPSHGSIAVFIFIVSCLTWILRLSFDTDHWETFLYVIRVEIIHVPQYVCMFALGTMCYHRNWFNKIKRSTGIMWFCIGITAVLILYFFKYYDYINNTQYLRMFLSAAGSGQLVWSIWETVICTGLLIGLIVFFREISGNTVSKITQQAAGSAYGAYILHILFVLALHLIFSEFNIDPFIKFLLVTAAAIILSFCTSFLLRLIPIVRRVI